MEDSKKIMEEKIKVGQFITIRKKDDLKILNESLANLIKLSSNLQSNPIENENLTTNERATIMRGIVQCEWENSEKMEALDYTGLDIKDPDNLVFTTLSGESVHNYLDGISTIIEKFKGVKEVEENESFTELKVALHKVVSFIEESVQENLNK